MKLTLQTQLLPDREQAQKLSATMQAFNAADWLASEAFCIKSACDRGFARWNAA